MADSSRNGIEPHSIFLITISPYEYVKCADLPALFYSRHKFRIKTAALSLPSRIEWTAELTELPNGR